MAETGIRQLGEPRIGIYADRQKPDPLHLEINSWQHILNVLYLEAVRRGRYECFDTTMRSSKSANGCGLKYVADQRKEHYNQESSRMKSLTIRLIGAQAIKLAQYSYRLVDSLEIEIETDSLLLSRLALSKICEKLRDIGSVMNRVTPPDYVSKIEKLCKEYFNIYALFFPKFCNITVWTLGHIIPFHAADLFKRNQIGYGILTMQGKESKHSSIKQELKSCSNRSNDENERGKWYQLMPSNFIRNFYLPHHIPIFNNSYHSHFQSRIPIDVSDDYCFCSRHLAPGEDNCFSCKKSIELMECATMGKLTSGIDSILKPVECDLCKIRFADKSSLGSHSAEAHSKLPLTNGKSLNPLSMSVFELKRELKLRNQSISGNKDILKRRLEGVISL